MPALDCNCSVCRMTGYLTLSCLTAVRAHHRPRRADRLSLRDGTAEHLFCRHCGVKSFYQPRSHPDAWSVNANCLDQPGGARDREVRRQELGQAEANLDARE